jgi:hypothetical protein
MEKTYKMAMDVFWDAAPCSLIEIDLIFQRCLLAPSSGTYGPDEGSRSVFETPVNLYETARRNLPEYGQLHAQRRKNLKSNLLYILAFP